MKHAYRITEKLDNSNINKENLYEVYFYLYLHSSKTIVYGSIH